MFSEDPYLSGALGASQVNGLQSTKVGVSIKHLVNNEAETRRKNVSADLSMRALREVYLKPFEIVQKLAKPFTYMTAYNRVNGVHASEHQWLLEQVICKEWGFDGLVMSDWWGTYSTVDSLVAGMDLEMPGPSAVRAGAVNFYIKSGKLGQRVVDKSVLTILFIKDCIAMGLPERIPKGFVDTAETQALLRRASAAAIVLLKNSKQLLPISPKVKKIAVIGHHASLPYYGGGYPANANPVRYITPLQGLTEARPWGTSLSYNIGAYSHILLPLLGRLMRSPSSGGKSAGFDLKFYNEDPEQASLEPANTLTFKESICLIGTTRVENVIRNPWMRLEGLFTPEASGSWEFGLVMIGQGKLYVADELVVDNWADQKPGQELFGFGMSVLNLKAGQTYKVTLKTESLVDASRPGPRTGFRLGAALQIDAKKEIENACAAAADADVAVVVVGLSPEYESEDFDRKHLKLPGLQNELVKAVIERQPNTVVVTQSGMPVELPWVDQADTLVSLAYPGNEGGHCLADVLFGKVSPAGKLTSTWPKRLEDHPTFLSFPGEHDHMPYTEDVFVGHRYFEAIDRQPMFPFGHGLSYTSFALAVDKIEEVEKLHYSLTLSVRNTGSVAGAEVVQVYVGDLSSSVKRPRKELKGFAKVHAEPGQTTTVQIALERDAFAFWSVVKDEWVVEAGEFAITVGNSSSDGQAIKSIITIGESHSWGPEI